MSVSIVSSAVIQELILAICFILIPVAARKYGQKAQDAAEKSVTNQGFDRTLLKKNGIKMNESKTDMLLPFAFAIAYLVLACTGIINGNINHTVLWIVEGFTFLVVEAVTVQQVFVVAFLRHSFSRSKDPELPEVNVEAFVSAAVKEFPRWLRHLQLIRFLTATIGSVMVLMLLALH